MDGCALVNTRISRDPNMSLGKTLLCDSCSGRWDRVEFWHSCPSEAEASQETWGHVLQRTFGEMEENGQCRFCRLICNALTQRGRRPIPKDTEIYFSKLLFGEYKSNSTAPWDHGTASQFVGSDEPTWQRHFVNRLCVSTFPSLDRVKRDNVWVTQSGIPLCEYSECHIALVRENADNHRFFHGRQINPTFDTNLARQWIETCNAAHHTKCPPPPVIIRPSRVINVRERRVEYTPSSCSYVALSYRWPDPPGLMLTSVTEDALMKTGGLAHVDGIPPIVEDSMALLEKLGQTYLWVDALCNPQGKEGPQHLLDEQKHQIDAMKDIYRGAEFTIVANCDSNSKRGLPGIRDRTRRSQKSTSTDDLTFAIAKPDLIKAGEKSEWNSRIWTFQEAAQPRRLLIFTDHQVFFHCNGAMWREDTFLELPGQQDIRVIDAPPPEASYWRNKFPEQQLEFPDWVGAVEQYTPRTATRETDFPLGLEFLKTYNSVFCCIPRRYFALALCFETWGGKRRALDSPSWCWCHWRFPRGTKYGSQAAFSEDLAGNFPSRRFDRVGYDATEHILFPIQMDALQLSTYSNAMEASSINGRVELSNLVAFYPYVLTGIFSVGEDGLHGDCKIAFPLRDPSTDPTTTYVHAGAILALDCGKIEGDLVTCADVLLDLEIGEIWLLVVETVNGFSRRIGTASMNLTDWELVVKGLKTESMFLA